MSEYTPTIGLEIHAELKTQTKMFCSSKNDPDETEPNVNVCPVCLAHPGTLPVVNREAVRHVLRVGLALRGKLADYTEFDRKNYFYPDLPKGYQISQYEYPLVSGGELCGVAITRVHLEEDTASSIHSEKGGETLIDYNRAGVPLMELVTEPVIHSAQQAGEFGRELQMLLRYLHASDADMEKGQMRLEANISLSNDGKLGTKVEVKNINSFRAMERAVAFEIERQRKVLEAGEKVVQETRGWDDVRHITFSQRAKEGSADYRYFPDPDIPSFKLSQLKEFSADALRSTLPELPAQRRTRYLDSGIKSEDADSYVRNPSLGDFVDDVVRLFPGDSAAITLASNYIANDLVSLIADSAAKRDINDRDTELQADIPISAANFKKIIDLLMNKKISSRSAKDLLVASIQSAKDPEVIARESGLFQNSDTDALQTVVSEVVAKHEAVVQDYRNGKVAALEFLVGQCMKILRGAADAGTLREMLKASIG